LRLEFNILDIIQNIECRTLRRLMHMIVIIVITISFWGGMFFAIMIAGRDEFLDGRFFKHGIDFFIYAQIRR